MPGACQRGGVTGSPAPPGRLRERRAQRLGASRSCSLHAEPLAARPGEEGVKPWPLRSRMSKGGSQAAAGSWESPSSLKDPVPDYVPQAPGLSIYVKPPILQGAGWGSFPFLLRTEVTLPHPQMVAFLALPISHASFCLAPVFLQHA